MLRGFECAPGGPYPRDGYAKLILKEDANETCLVLKDNSKKYPVTSQHYKQLWISISVVELVFACLGDGWYTGTKSLWWKKNTFPTFKTQVRKKFTKVMKQEVQYSIDSFNSRILKENLHGSNPNDALWGKHTWRKTQQWKFRRASYSKGYLSPSEPRSSNESQTETSSETIYFTMIR